MTAVSTLIRKVQSDPRYPRYVKALLASDISLETASRAAAVRIESEDADDIRWARYEATQRPGRPLNCGCDRYAHQRSEWNREAFRMPGSNRR